MFSYIYDTKSYKVKALCHHIGCAPFFGIIFECHRHVCRVTDDYISLGNFLHHTAIGHFPVFLFHLVLYFRITLHHLHLILDFLFSHHEIFMILISLIHIIGKCYNRECNHNPEYKIPDEAQQYQGGIERSHIQHSCYG